VYAHDIFAAGISWKLRRHCVLHHSPHSAYTMVSTNSL
jgi:hypothetical protein